MDNPPPYSQVPPHHLGFPEDLLQRQEFEEFTNVHTALVTVHDTYTINGLAQDLGTLYHWHHSDPEAFVAIPFLAPCANTSLSENLQSFSGFKDHGIIKIATGCPLIEYLPSLITHTVNEMRPSEQTQDTDMDGNIIKHLLSKLKTSQSDAPELQWQLPVAFYSIRVHTCSSTPDALFDGEEMIWKNVKPSSPYPQNRVWSTTIGRVVCSPQGREAFLLVKGISKEQKERWFKERGFRTGVIIPGESSSNSAEFETGRQQRLQIRVNLVPSGPPLDGFGNPW